jgi:hypothetical protein
VDLTGTGRRKPAVPPAVKNCNRERNPLPVLLCNKRVLLQKEDSGRLFIRRFSLQFPSRVLIPIRDLTWNIQYLSRFLSHSAGRHSVIPAEAGIQTSPLGSRFRGNDGCAKQKWQGTSRTLLLSIALGTKNHGPECAGPWHQTRRT